tara:strand:+ start:8559 stop:9842 length:1284 start_codon:yes stop_codon:yes gene_type:complete
MLKNNLPSNWVITKLKAVVAYKKGKKPKILKENEFENSVPYLDVRAFEKGEIRRFADIKSSNLITKNDVGILWDGARSGWSTKGKNGAVGSTIAILTPLKINSTFLYLFLQSKYNFLNSNTRGTGIPHVDPQILWGLGLPLPPRPEQERIVAKVDRLMAQVKIMQKSLERIPQLLKDFKQQVLTQAVTGKLTEEWREGKHFDDWKVELAKNCCEKVQSGGTPKGSNFAESGIPFFKVYNIVNQKISFDYKPQFVSEEIQNSQCKKSICFPNDVLMNIVGPPLNKVAIVPKEFPECNINQAITLFRVKEYLNSKYLYYFLCEGSSVNKLVNETRGVVGQINISLTQCRSFEISIPSKEEQQEIVHRVESLFAQADIIEEKYKCLKAKIDNLPQAILHKAFKGELVEQLPTDGNARELLKEIEGLKKVK